MKKIRKLKKIKIGYVFAGIILIAFLILVIKLVLPGADNKYGDRLEGIKDAEFTEKAQKKVTKGLTDNEKVTKASIHIEGKLINVIYTVKNETSKDEAKAIAGSTLGLFSDKVKGFYDIQFMVKKEKEEGVKTTNSEGEEVTKYEFPIMGYSSKKNSGIVWSNN